jgi:hypothetical protein
MLITTGCHKSNSFTRCDSIGGSPEGGRKMMEKSGNLIVFENPLIE